MSIDQQLAAMIAEALEPFEQRLADLEMQAGHGGAEEWLSVKAAAQVVGRDVSSVYKWISDGRLKANNSLGHKLIARSDLDRAIRGEES